MPITRDRIRARVELFHQPHSRNPRSFIQCFSDYLKSNEQVYERWVAIGEKWVELDIGWLTETGASFLLITNEEGAAPNTTLTEEQKTQLAGQVLEVRHVDSSLSWCILPGQFLCGATFGKLMIRCSKGSARSHIVALPP